jgi:hypothetical protein
MPPLTISKVMRLVQLDKMELAEALNKVTEDAMAEQQAKEQQMAEQQQQTPDMANADATVRSMTGQQSPIPGTDAMPGMSSLGDMLGALRRPAMTVQPMRGVERGAV